MPAAASAAGSRRRTVFNPASLFAAGEQGFWLHVHPTYLWQDTARTAAAVVDAQVRAFTDRSGRGNHGTTASADVAPYLRQASGRYYLEFDGVDDNMTASIPFGTAGALSIFASLRNRAQTDLAGYLELLSSASPGPATFRARQRAVGGTTAWDCLLAAIAGEGSNTAAAANTVAPNTMIMSSQHDIAADLSTVRVNKVAGTNGTGDKGANALGTMAANIGKLQFRPAAPMNLGGLIVRGALTPDPVPTEDWLNANGLAGY